MRSIRGFAQSMVSRAHTLKTKLFPPPPQLEPVERVVVTARAERTRREAQQYFATPERKGLLECVVSSISTGADLTDYYVLHHYIVTRRPRRILELGSGVTSVIMAHALREVAEADPSRPPGHLETMEDLPAFHADAQRLCSPALRPFVTYSLSGLHMERKGQLWMFCYVSLPPGPFDLVFVDGPLAKRDGKTGVNGDVLRLMELAPDAALDVVIDNRLPTCIGLAPYFPERLLVFDQALRIGCMRGMSGRALRAQPARSRPLPDVDVFEHLGIKRWDNGAPTLGA